MFFSCSTFSKIKVKLLYEVQWHEELWLCLIVEHVDKEWIFSISMILMLHFNISLGSIVLSFLWQHVYAQVRLRHKKHLVRLWTSLCYGLNTGFCHPEYSWRSPDVSSKNKKQEVPWHFIKNAWSYSHRHGWKCPDVSPINTQWFHTWNTV